MAKIKTAPEKKNEPCQAQLIYEKVLGSGTLFLVLMHMLLALCRNIFDPFIFRPFESWYLVVLITVAFVYPILCLILWRDTVPRLGYFLKRLVSPAQIFCMLLFAWYILSCLINQNEYDSSFFELNDWWLLDAFVNCFILFSLPRVLSESKAKKYIHILLHVIVLCGTAIAVYALHCLFTLNIVTLPAGGQIGMSPDETFNIGAHYNVSAAIELTMILVCLYMLASQKWLLKIPYALALPIHTYVLLLNNSRAAFVACMFSYALALFLMLWNGLYQKPAVLRWIAGFTGAAAAAGILWAARPWSFQLFEDVTHFSELLALRQSSDVGSFLNNAAYTAPCLIQNAPQLTNAVSSSLFMLLPGAWISRKKAKLPVIIPAAVLIFALVCVFAPGRQADESAVYRYEAQPTVANALFVQDGSAVLHQAADEGEKAVRKLSDPMNRVNVWRGAVNVMKGGPLFFFFGVTPVGVSTALREIGGLDFDFAHAHNELLQMGVALGVPMMVLFAAFLIYMTIKSIRLGMAEGRKHFQGAYMVPIVFAGLAVLTLAEAYLFGYFCIMSSIFFLFCGWINALTDKK